MTVTAKQVRDTLQVLKAIDPEAGPAFVAKEMGVSTDTLYRWRSAGCDQRTILAIECLVRRALERRAEKAEKELDAIRSELNDMKGEK